MDEKKVREIISDFAGFYNAGRLYPHEIRRLLEERCDDVRIIEELFRYTTEKNKRPSTFRFGINGRESEEIFRNVNNSLQGV